METGWDLGARQLKSVLVRKVSTESLKPIFHKCCVLASVLWLKRKFKRASGVTCWPLQNLAMASDVNEKQRGRGMLGGDPFGTPRTPSCVLHGPPRWIRFHSWRWRKNAGIDGRLLERNAACWWCNLDPQSYRKKYESFTDILQFEVAHRNKGD